MGHLQKSAPASGAMVHPIHGYRLFVKGVSFLLLNLVFFFLSNPVRLKIVFFRLLKVFHT